MLRKHAKAAGIDGKSFGPHALRAMAATKALDRGADLGKVQEWLGHAIGRQLRQIKCGALLRLHLRTRVVNEGRENTFWHSTFRPQEQPKKAA